MKEIIVYTSDTCPHCHTAKDYLTEKGFKFKERNVSRDPLARQELMNHHIMGVPAFIIGNESVVGLDREKIETLIDYTVESCPHCQHRTRVPKGIGKVKITCKACKEPFIIQTKNM